jgi:integrase
MAIHKLSARQVETAKAGKLSDGGGLYLIVGPGTSKRWAFIFKPSKGAKDREMGLGSAREGSTRFVSLVRARELAAEGRETLAKGIDPIKAREEATAPPAPPFGEFADTYVETMEAGWRNAKHRAQWRQSLRDHAGTLREKRLDAIGTEDVLGILKPIWLTKAETARRVRSRVERILDAARVAGHRSGENPARWKGHLDKLLPKPPKLTRGHHPAMPYAEVPAFIAKLQERPAVAALALEFTILTAARSAETLGAAWLEIDRNAKLWTVRGERMKSWRRDKNPRNHDHRVPLSARALEILDEMHKLGTEGFIFPGQRPKHPLSSMALEMLLRRMGIGDATPHGFRSSFRDWAGDCTSFPREVAEAALSHAAGDETEQAYRRGDALQKRRRLMDAWARYCGRVPSANVIEPKFGQAAR